MNENEKIQELLKPRYILTADYPGCSFEVGTILEPNAEGELYSKTAGYSWTVSRILEKDVKKFKDLLRKLEWWEERTPEEMPQYVKCTKTPDQIIQPGDILKVEWFEVGGGKAENGPRIFLYTKCYEPATSADYLSFISKQKV